MSSGIGNRKMAAAPVCCSNSCPVALKCAWKKIYAHDLRSPSPDQLTQQPFFLASTSVLRKRDSVSSSVSIRKVVMSAAHHLVRSIHCSVRVLSPTHPTNVEKLVDFVLVIVVVHKRPHCWVNQHLLRWKLWSFQRSLSNNSLGYVYLNLNIEYVYDASLVCVGFG